MIYKDGQTQQEPQAKNVMVQGYTIPEHPYSDHTQYLKYVNDFPGERELDPKFAERNADFTRVLNKYPGQSNIDEIDELKIDLLWKDIELSRMHGMFERAERLSLKLDHLYARSRGRDGFGSRIQVTERHEIMQNEQDKEPEKKGFGFFRHKKKEPQVQVYANQPQPQQGAR
jgi:hypothetical protein